MWRCLVNDTTLAVDVSNWVQSRQLMQECHDIAIRNGLNDVALSARRGVEMLDKAFRWCQVDQ